MICAAPSKKCPGAAKIFLPGEVHWISSALSLVPHGGAPRSERSHTLNPNTQSATVRSHRNRVASQREYETVLILKSDVSKAQIKRIVTNVQKTFSEGGASLLSADNWGLRTLAYPIKRQKRGIYVYLRFLGGSDTVTDFERKLRLTDAVLRYLTVKIDEDIDPLTAGLDFAVALDKGSAEGESEGFIGQEALQAIAADGPAKRLIGLRLAGRRAARQGMVVRDGDREVGTVTSGCLSPTLDASIAMAIVDRDATDEGRALSVDLGRAVDDAVVTPLPFYTRST